MFISAANAAAAGGSTGGLMGILPFVLIFVVFYFLMIRPQQKKMKQHKEMTEGLRRGDNVITQGGIYGKVSKIIDDSTVEVEVASGVKIKVVRSSVNAVVGKTDPAPAVDKKDTKDK
jgi:preprotein translocase subunit YajC